MMPRKVGPGLWVSGLTIGGVMAMGHAPFSFVWAVFPALVAFAVFMRRQATTPLQAALAGWIVGLAYFGITLSWIVHPFFVEPDKHGWMAPFAAILLPAGVSLFWALGFGVMTRLAGARWGWPLGLIWAELARAYVFTGFPWANFASLYVDTVAAGLVPYVGALGLSVAVVMIAGRVANIPKRWAMVTVTVFVSLMVALPRPAPAPVTQGPLVRMVQPNAAQADKWNPDKAEVFYQRLLDATAADPVPDLVVWPETAIPYVLEFAQPILSEVADHARGAAVVTGINRGAINRYYNSLITIAPDGSVADVYDKRHLVPFGEYIPMGEVFAKLGIHGLAASQGGGFTAGDAAKVIPLAGIGNAVPLICYEGLFPVLSHVQDEARLIILITNDAWFGPAAGPQQHLVQSQLRALEQGLPVVRVANTGITAMIDANGHITQRLPMNQDGHLDAILPPQAANRPLFAKYGEWPAIIFILISTAFGIAAMSRIRIDRASADR